MSAFFHPFQIDDNSLSMSSLCAFYWRIQSFRNQVTATQAPMTKINIAMIHKLVTVSF